MSYNFLDKTGLILVWGKIKNALSDKVDKVDGKGLSTNDYTSNEKTKLANIATGAQVNVLEGIQKNGTNVTITNKIANISVPTTTNELTNNSGFITIADVPEGAIGSTTTPSMDGTAAVGTELAFARGDHIHPTDTTRAAVTDVLTKTNTTSYAPTSDYHPATKKYVDDNIGRAGILVVNITDGEEEGTYESDKTFVEISEAITEGKDIKCIYWNNIYHLVYNNNNNNGFLQFQNRINIDVDDPQYSDINDIYFNVIQIDIFNNTIDVFQDRCEVPLPSITTPLMNGTSSIGNSKKYAKADHMHPTDTTRAAVNDVLIKTNTTSYTPTADYHPATKKYVDDSIPDQEIIVVRIIEEYDEQIDDDVYSANKTFLEIQNAIDNGLSVVLIYNIDLYFFVDIIQNSYIIFHSEIGIADVASKSIVSRNMIRINSDDSIEIDTEFLPSYPNVSIYNDPTPGQILKFVNQDNSYFWTNANLPTYSISMSNNIITLTDSDGNTSSITLPIYNGGVSS